MRRVQGRSAARLRDAWCTAVTLVTVCGLLAAPAPAAGPELTQGPDDHPAVHKTADVPIVMSDGVTLLADIYRPARADGSPVEQRFPVVLGQKPYNKNSPAFGGVVETFVRHGYVHVIVDVRGTGNSGGHWDSFGPREQQDSREIAAWLVQQPFSDGRWATYGTSYMAINQFFTGAARPAGLKAMFPIIPAQDVYRDVIWHGGSIDAGFIPLWMGAVTGLGALPVGAATSDPAQAAAALMDHVQGAARFQVPAAASMAGGGDLAYDGDFYRQRSPGTVADRIDVPTFVVGGWWDLFQRGEPLLYQQLDLPAGRKQLLMGPWYHITAGRGLGAKDTPPTLETLALAWFDRWVKGERNGVEDFGPVTLYEIGSGRWTTQRAYPGVLEYRRLYLTPRKSGTSGNSVNDGTLASGPPESASSVTNPANPVAGVCSRSSAQWTAGAFTPGQQCESDNRVNETGALVFTSPPLGADTRVSGPLGLTLRASTTARDTTWIATVTDVAPSGESNELTMGWLMSSRRAVDRARSTVTPDGDLVAPFHPFTRESLQPVTPGKLETLNVELFGTNALLRKGHRLRLALTNGDIPHLLATAPDAVAQIGAVNTVAMDPRSPSFLTFGVLPDDSLLARRRACASRRRFSIRVREPRRGVRLRSVRVRVDGRAAKVRRSRGRWTAVVDLRGKRKGRYRVTVTAEGSDGRVYRDDRRYRTCAGRR